MKKIILYLAAALFLFANVATAQTKFTQGTVQYKIDVESDNDQVKQMFNNSTLTMHIKDKKAVAEMAIGVMMNMKVINFADDKKVVMLMDMMGQKKQINMTEKDFKEYKKKQKKDYKIEYKIDTMTIAGYHCKKALITADSGKAATFWYTEELLVDAGTNPMGSDYEKLKGFPMCYQQMQNGVAMTFTVTSVDKKPVDDKVFEIPAGYDIMDMKELMMMQGGR